MLQTNSKLGERALTGVPERYMKIHNNERLQMAARAEAAGVALLLRKVFGVQKDADLALGEFGKPEIAGISQHISISHSNFWVVLAVAELPIGIDIEPDSRGFDDCLSRHIFPRDVQWELELLDEKDRDERFLAYWCSLEAALKAHGTGFATDEKLWDIFKRYRSYSFHYKGNTVAYAAKEPLEYNIVEYSSSELLDNV